MKPTGFNFRNRPILLRLFVFSVRRPLRTALWATGGCQCPFSSCSHRNFADGASGCPRPWRRCAGSPKCMRYSTCFATVVAAPPRCGCLNHLCITMPLPTSSDGHGAPRERELARRQQHWNTVLSTGGRTPTPTREEYPLALPPDSAALAVTPARPLLPRHDERIQPLPPQSSLPPLLPDNARNASLPTESTAQPRVSKLASFDALLAVAQEQHMHFAAETRAPPTPPSVAGQLLRATSPPLRSQFGSSNTPAYEPAEPVETSALADRRLLHGASMWPAPVDTATDWSPPVRDGSTMQKTAPPGLPGVLPSTSTGLETHVQTAASAPLSSYAHGAPTAGRGRYSHHVTLSLPRLLGLPMSSPGSVGSLLRNRSVQGSCTPSGDHAGSQFPSSVAAVASSPMQEPFSNEKLSFGAASSALGAADFGLRHSQLPLLYTPPMERAPSAALSLLAEASNEQLPLHLGRKRSREPPMIPFHDHREERAAGEARRKPAPRVLQEVMASAIRLNPPIAGLPAPLATLRPRKKATSEPLQFIRPMLTPLARASSDVNAAGSANQPWQDTTATSRPPPPAESELPSMGLPVSRIGVVSAAHDTANPLLAQKTPSRLRPPSSSSNPAMTQSERMVVSGSDIAALRSSGPVVESDLPVLHAQAHQATSASLPTDPGAGLDAALLAARPLPSGPTQSTGPATPGSLVARSTLEPKAPAGEAQVLWLCDRCDRPYKWKQTLQAHRRYVRSGLSGCVGQQSRVS